MEFTHSREVGFIDITAVIFDANGVPTDTASIYAEAWRQLFDE